jgi:hypothetical protein
MGWMGPIVGDVDHEGWVVPLYADGAEGTGTSSGRGYLVRDRHGREEWRPGVAVVGWLAGCECGWRGRPWTRVPAPTLADPKARLLAVTGDWADLEEDDETLVMDDWREHIAPWLHLEAVAAAADEVTAAAGRLTESVRSAVAAGATWADVGRAAGMTRQSAHERWAHVRPR